MTEQIETLDQWYQALQTTYDKWNEEVQNINMKIKELSSSIVEEDHEDHEDHKDHVDHEDDEDKKDNLEYEVTQLKKKISQITPTLEKYKYYLDFKTNQTSVKDLDLIQFD